jgi:Carbamoylphosphate synthase large subunit (split gene in MJ)
VKQRILISAAGVPTAFHLCELIRTRFPKHFAVYLCDTNPKHLVAAAGFAHRFWTVPPANHPDFRRTLLDILRIEQIEIYVPLVDKDVYTFPADDVELQTLGVRSTAPPARSAAVLKSKRTLSGWLKTKSVAVPRVFTSSEVVDGGDSEEYFVKPDDGVGSRGASLMTAAQLCKLAEEKVTDELLIQEVCKPPEYTVEVYNARGKVVTICRERLETKAGVCTKARIWTNSQMQKLARKLCKELELPVAFCFQVMRNKAGKWAVTDLNPRLGAGTSLSSICGWSLASAALVTWADLPMNPFQYLPLFKSQRFAVRAYRDIRTR